MKKYILLLLLIISVENSWSEKLREEYFQIDVENDFSIILSGLQIAIPYITKTFSMKEYVYPRSIRVESTSPIDSLAIFPYNEAHNDASDVLQFMLIGASGIMFLKENFSDILKISVMYTETLLITNALARFSKIAFEKNRPYTYFSDEEEDFPTNPKNSFFSAHTSTAFANAAFLTSVYSSYNPHSKSKYIVGIASFCTASTIGILRITSGNHFISDVLVGAFVGTAVGLLVPYNHKPLVFNEVDLILFIDPSVDFGINLNIRF